MRTVENSQLAYIGQTGKSLRARLYNLRRNALMELMPFNDPHTAAPNVWAWIQEGLEFECSAATVELAERERKALEDFLLWQHRLISGESTLCNYGRFHPGYIKSSGRKAGRRGGKLPKGEVNPSWGPSSNPLLPSGVPIDPNWMGLSWSSLMQLNSNNVYVTLDSVAIYKFIGFNSQQLLYVGQTSHLNSRLRQHLAKEWKTTTNFSFHRLPDQTPEYQMHELESDLLGAYFSLTNTAPEFQYGT